MALVRNEFGIKGARVGNVVFCKLNGKSYMRSVPDRIDPNTPQQQEVRSRFRWLRVLPKIKETPLKGILDLSADKICSSGYALLMKKNLKAFRANGKIGDFSQLHFSAGKRQQAYNLQGRMDEQGWSRWIGRMTRRHIILRRQIV